MCALLKGGGENPLWVVFNQTFSFEVGRGKWGQQPVRAMVMEWSPRNFALKHDVLSNSLNLSRSRQWETLQRSMEAGLTGKFPLC